MKMSLWLILNSLAVFAPFVSVAQGAVESRPTYVMCRSQKVVRTIRVIDKGENCNTVYTKAGVDKIVGEAKSRNSCFEVLKNIRGNLEGAAWKCKDISSATVTDTESGIKN